MYTHHDNLQRGDVAVYMALMISFILLSSALVFSLILARQIRATEDVVESERSFYAANSGLEHLQYVLTKGWNNAYSATIITRPDPGPGIIEYSGGEQAEYTARGKYDAENESSCAQADGTFRNEKRRLQIGLGDCLL